MFVLKIVYVHLCVVCVTVYTQEHIHVNSSCIYNNIYFLIWYQGMESDDDDGGFEDLPYRIQVAYDATIGTYMCVLVCTVFVHIFASSKTQNIMIIYKYALLISQSYY